MIMGSYVQKRNFEFRPDFFSGGLRQNFGEKNVNRPPKKIQTEIQNSASIRMSPEPLVFMSRKDFVDKRKIGREKRL